jgi:hypothetical protein
VVLAGDIGEGDRRTFRLVEPGLAVAEAEERLLPVLRLAAQHDQRPDHQQGRLRADGQVEHEGAAAGLPSRGGHPLLLQEREQLRIAKRRCDGGEARVGRRRRRGSGRYGRGGNRRRRGGGRRGRPGDGLAEGAINGLAGDGHTGDLPAAHLLEEVGVGEADCRRGLGQQRPEVPRQGGPSSAHHTQDGTAGRGGLAEPLGWHSSPGPSCRSSRSASRPLVRAGCGGNEGPSPWTNRDGRRGTSRTPIAGWPAMGEAEGTLRGGGGRLGMGAQRGVGSPAGRRHPPDRQRPAGVRAAGD